MHYLRRVIKEVDSSHPHLGNLVAVSMLAVKARKFLLIVSPRGCGKSRVTSLIAEHSDKALTPDAISRAGMADMEGALSNFDGVLVVDDLSKAGTHYAMIHTVASLAELCYGHKLEVYLRGSETMINHFEAGILANIQPILLREVIKSPLWESSMMDKSIRYYHLLRPIKPNPLPPKVNLDWGVGFDEVEVPELKGKLADRLCVIGEAQWGVARTKEHILDLLRASAALDDRRVVLVSDYNLLLRLLVSLSLEEIVCDRVELESKRYLNSNTLAVLTEFLTYGQFTMKQLTRDYKLSPSRGYQIMAKMQKDWVIVAKDPTMYAPSEELKSKLKEVGLL